MRWAGRGKRSSTGGWTSTWRRRRRAVALARKSWITSARGQLAAAGELLECGELGEGWARSVAAILALSGLRWSGLGPQPLDHVVLGHRVLARV